MFDAFYSDPHFGHKNIIGFCQRPFKNLTEMHEALVDNYNSVITRGMTVLWCGDAFFRCDANEAHHWLKQLNGRKVIVKGNHDPSDAVLLGIGFRFVTHEMVLSITGKTCRVSHYPYAFTEEERQARIEEGLLVDDRYMSRRPRRRSDEYLIHGHTHSNVKKDGRAIHVGVDAWDYAPATYDEVGELLRSSA